MVAAHPGPLRFVGDEDSSKRRQILEGASRVFMDLGFDGASMGEIARAAGVSKGTLYAYFGSKDELFEAIIRAEKGQAAERLCAFRREGDVREMLTDFGVRLMQRICEPGTLALARVVIAAAEKFPNRAVDPRGQRVKERSFTLS